MYIPCGSSFIMITCRNHFRLPHSQIRLFVLRPCVCGFPPSLRLDRTVKNLHTHNDHKRDSVNVSKHVFPPSEHSNCSLNFQTAYHNFLYLSNTFAAHFIFTFFTTVPVKSPVPLSITSILFLLTAPYSGIA